MSLSLLADASEMSYLSVMLDKVGFTVSFIVVVVFGFWRVLKYLAPLAKQWVDSQVSLVGSLQETSHRSASAIESLSEINKTVVTKVDDLGVKVERACRANCPPCSAHPQPQLH